MKNFLLVMLLVGLSSLTWGQNRQARIENLATAISRAEGFNVRGSISHRLHNPGNIRAMKGVKLPGQIGISKGRYIIFRSNRAGWAALMNQLEMIADERSRSYDLDMTFNDVAKRYAEGWRVWSKNITRILHVTGRTTLREYLGPEDDPGIGLKLLRVSVPERDFERWVAVL